MLVYNYDFLTKEYTGSEEASLDPEETKRQGKNVYLVPANATLKKPPTIQEHQTVLFENDKWKIYEDWRGYYIVNENMEPVQITELGAIPEGYAIITPEQIDLLNEYGHLYFIIVDGKLVVNPNYEEDKRKEEEQGWQLWHMTKYDFYKYVLQPNQITYTVLMQIVNSNEDIAAAWNLCAYVYLGDSMLTEVVKQYIPSMTDEALKEIFREHRIKE